MAGERRSTRRSQTPERVQQAAQAMNYSAPSGIQRGYIPQNTGGYPGNQTGGYNRQSTGGYPAGGYPGYQQQGYYRQPPVNQNPGNMQYVSSMSGGMRGFSMPPAATKEKRKNTHRKRTVLLGTLVVLSLAVMAGAFFLIRNLVENSRAEEANRARPVYPGHLRGRQ